MKSTLGLLLATIYFVVFSCQGQQRSYNSSSTSTNIIDSKYEISKWKKELLDSKRIGRPCTFDEPGGPSTTQWSNDNPDLYDGLPAHDSLIQVINMQLDQDSNADLLMYLVSENCTGHNGGQPSFAKIVFSNGKQISDLMTEIKDAILQDYNTRRKSNSALKEITQDYLDQKLTIQFNQKIEGEFSLYTSEDPHCCPSYLGFYTYNPYTHQIETEIKPTSLENGE